MEKPRVTSCVESGGQNALCTHHSELLTSCEGKPSLELRNRRFLDSGQVRGQGFVRLKIFVEIRRKGTVVRVCLCREFRF